MDILLLKNSHQLHYYYPHPQLTFSLKSCFTVDHDQQAHSRHRRYRQTGTSYLSYCKYITNTHRAGPSHVSLLRNQDGQ
jgi:hypothetical protein